MQRFFVADTPLEVGRGVALDALAHQLHTVLRLPAGSDIVLLDGSEQEFVARLTHVTAHQAAAAVLAVRACAAEPAVYLTLYQCSLKQDKFEWVLQKGTELGVARFVPVVSARSVVRPVAALVNKVPRWQAIVREAAEQSGRGRLPALAAPIELREGVTGDRVTGGKFVLWEQAGKSISLGDAVTPACQSHASHLSPVTPSPVILSPVAPHLSLLIGPEGGLTPEEVQLAESHGWQVVTLGPRILRAETAALAAVTVVMERCGQLGSGLASSNF